jgi:DNA repair protein SbcD/Mre11
VSSFRFIHTGDIHLDSPLRGLTGQEGPAADRIRTATRAAFENLITQAIEERVAFVVIAGDLYDGDWRDYQTGLFFVRQMGRLAAAKIPAYLLYSNHDAESQITKRLSLPQNVHVFSAKKPETFKLEEHRVALHGQSFRTRDISDNLASAYPGPLSGYFNIGVLHTALGGTVGHANYAPCTIDDLINRGYDYWALAHVHQGSILREKPHIVFCGNLQGRHIREAGAKSAQMVTVADGDIEEITTVHTDVVRWVHLLVPMTDCARIGDVVDQIKSCIEAAVRQADGRLIACRIELTGKTEIHGQMLASANHLTAEARAAALALGEEVAWIERLVISTEAASGPSVRLQEEALGDLSIMMTQAVTDIDLQQQRATDIGELIRKLPHSVESESDDPVLQAATAKDFASVSKYAGDYLTARLATTGRG